MYAVECAERDTGRPYAVLYDAGTSVEALNAAAADGHLASRAVEVAGSSGPGVDVRPLLDVLVRIETRLGTMARADVIRRPRRTLLEGLWLWVLTVLLIEAAVVIGFGVGLWGLGWAGRNFVAQRQPQAASSPSHSSGTVTRPWPGGGR